MTAHAPIGRAALPRPRLGPMFLWRSWFPPTRVSHRRNPSQQASRNSVTAPGSSPPTLTLRTLGDVRLDGGVTALASRRKELTLLAYLARRAPRSATRAELAALLWEDRAETRARQSLRQALVDLKRLVGAALLLDGDSVRLEPGLRLDAREFEEELARATRRPPSSGGVAISLPRWTTSVERTSGVGSKPSAKVSAGSSPSPTSSSSWRARPGATASPSSRTRNGGPASARSTRFLNAT